MIDFKALMGGFVYWAIIGSNILTFLAAMAIVFQLLSLRSLTRFTGSSNLITSFILFVFLCGFVRLTGIISMVTPFWTENAILNILASLAWVNAAIALPRFLNKRMKEMSDLQGKVRVLTREVEASGTKVTQEELSKAIETLVSSLKPKPNA